MNEVDPMTAQRAACASPYERGTVELPAGVGPAPTTGREAI